LSCNHENTYFVSGKFPYWVWPDGEKGPGYAPYIPGTGGGDYVEIRVCIDCQVCVGFPTKEKLLELQKEDREKIM